MLNCFAHGYYAQKMVNNGYFCTYHLAIDLKRDEQPLIVPKVLNVMTNNYYATDIQIWLGAPPRPIPGFVIRVSGEEY